MIVQTAVQTLLDQVPLTKENIVTFARMCLSELILYTFKIQHCQQPRLAGKTVSERRIYYDVNVKLYLSHLLPCDFTTAIME